MPLINDYNLQQHKLGGGTYGYSATKITDLGATEYTLVTIAQDVSASVQDFKQLMEKALKEIVNACRLSPRADNLLLRVVLFSSSVKEGHGFKLLSEINANDYDNFLKTGGMTALFDAAENAITVSNDYAKQLVANDFSTNGIIFIITDGENNSSTNTTKTIKDAIDKVKKSEALESLATILVGVGTQQTPELSKKLDQFKNESNLDQYIDIEKADAKSLAKLAAFVSKSISAQSQALGTKYKFVSVSDTLTF